MSITLGSKVQYLIGVGPKIAEKLNKLGIFCVKDLLLYYPRDYKDFSDITRIGDIGRHSEQSEESRRSFTGVQDDSGRVTIRGKIIEIANKRTLKRNFTVTEAIVEDESGSIKVVWFNQPFLLKMLRPSRELILNGKVGYNLFSKEVVMESPERAAKPCIVPVYPETAGITSKYISKLVANCKLQVVSVEEWLPTEWTTKQTNHENSKPFNHLTIQPFNNLLPIQDAIRELHFPTSMYNIKKAQRRIAFDELFLISLRANLSKEEIKKEKAPVLDIDDEKIAEFVEKLPFELTADQKKATWQIVKDIKNPVPMNRLLNGDVGSGKTIVAAIAAYVAVRAGYRVAIMCPTSILASQHYKTFCDFFARENINIGLWTSENKKMHEARSMSHESESKKSHNSLFLPAGRHGILHNSNVIIGTQALIQKGVELENLGLVIVDEQHRFGVAQRAALQQLGSVSSVIPTNVEESSNKRSLGYARDDKKRYRPHFLSMTATPIPRTLHLALFGDLDISVIREKPADRKEIKTRFVSAQNREKAYQFIRKHIDSGRQSFVICPLIEDKSDSSIQNTDNSLGLIDERKTVMEEHKKLQAIYPEFKIGILHGRMKAKEKDAIMAEFVANKINILVSTSVVEVGVDVPNASVMVIEDAERFGLAQIHQFRGRVGRAEHQSFCFLFSSTMSKKALKRLTSLEMTSDGFRLAEIDLETRGPGAVFGTEQSGLLDLKMASLADSKLIEEASSAAKSIVSNDPELKMHPLLKDRVSEYMENKHLE